MAKGDTFAPMDVITVKLNAGHTIECIVLKVNSPPHIEKSWPWPSRTRLDVAYIKHSEWQMGEHHWYHADDPDVHLSTDGGELLARWAQHVLEHGCSPGEVSLC